MDQLRRTSPFAALVGASAAVSRFTLVDVGCSGGIDPVWRLFGQKLRAIGFDPQTDDCARLAAAEDLPGVAYVPAFVAAPPDGTYARARGGRPPLAGNPWDHLAVARTVELQAARRAAKEDRARLNLWDKEVLADPDAPVLLPDALGSRGIDSVDFLKIDVDGVDFGILSSLVPQLQDWRVLGLGLEVNFFGTDDATDHSFHNTDRFMRSQGFDLFGLTVRTYAHAALPSRYRSDTPGPAAFGRPFQGDALYLRDPWGRQPPDADPATLLKLAAIAALAGVPDLAAALLVRHRALLEPVFDVAAGLDLLAAQAQEQAPVGRRPVSYQEWMARFERDDPSLYGAAHTPDRMALEDAIVAMRNSTSWRVTAPLRWLGRLLRG